MLVARDASERVSTVIDGLHEGMGGLAKGLAIIECFDLDHPRLTVSEAAECTGLAPASARRCMRTLEQLGYLSYDGKYYRPAPRFARLAASYTDIDPLPSLATPLLEELREQLSETCSLSVLDGDEALFVARAEAHHFVATRARIGGRLPAAQTAIGRVLLADLDDAELEDHWTEAAELVRRERSAGYALADEEFAPGLRAIAVPVRGAAGNIVAAMSVSAVTARASNEDMRTRFLPALRSQADRLERML